MALREILNELQTAERFLVTSHVNPDGDAVGSALAMVRLIEALGKQAVPVLADGVPARYRFLRDAARVRRPSELDEGDRAFDAVVMLDSGEMNRIGSVEELVQPGMRRLNIDHHVSNDGYGDAACVDVRASATCEILLDLFRLAEVEVDEGAAEALYTGIMTDTGRFRFPNTSAKTLASAAHLVARGAALTEIAEEVYARIPEREMRCLGRVIERIELEAGGALAISYLLPEERGMDTDGFIDSLTGIKGVVLAALLRPLKDGSFKVSFRSKNHVNVSALAERFGGGGHEKAAGGKVSGPLEDALDAVKRACVTALEKADG